MAFLCGKPSSRKDLLASPIVIHFSFRPSGPHGAVLAGPVAPKVGLAGPIAAPILIAGPSGSITAGLAGHGGIIGGLGHW